MDLEKAVLVAKDVLAHLNTFRLRKGVYVAWMWDSDVSLRERIEKASDVQSDVAAITEACEVCAKGAFLLAKARVLDGVPGVLIRYGYGDSVSVNLADVFDAWTLTLMETAFEFDSSYGYSYEAPACLAVPQPGEDPEYDTRVKAAVAVGKIVNLVYGHLSLAERNREVLRIVAENIVANGGRYIPKMPTVHFS